MSTGARGKNKQQHNDEKRNETLITTYYDGNFSDNPPPPSPLQKKCWIQFCVLYILSYILGFLRNTFSAVRPNIFCLFVLWSINRNFVHRSKWT